MCIYFHANITFEGWGGKRYNRAVWSRLFVYKITAIIVNPLREADWRIYVPVNVGLDNGLPLVGTTLLSEPILEYSVFDPYEETSVKY